MVDKDAVSLPIRSPKLFSLAALYDANKELLEPMTEGGDYSHTNELVGIAVDYWNAVAKVIPDWGRGEGRRPQAARAAAGKHLVSRSRSCEPWAGSAPS